MRASVGLLLLLTLVLADLPSGARTLVRYRKSDGSVGLVDDVSKVPAGATILERRAGAHVAAHLGLGSTLFW
ncbi:MAG TPA: hypothetical protein VKM54_06830 [Myxococcota bacterium]|nr:hypothetical protein [Myxococcota bacterium]